MVLPKTNTFTSSDRGQRVSVVAGSGIPKDETRHSTRDSLIPVESELRNNRVDWRENQSSPSLLGHYIIGSAPTEASETAVCFLVRNMRPPQ